MIKREITITNKTGLHARPASMFVQTAGKFKSSVTIEKETKPSMPRALSRSLRRHCAGNKDYAGD